MELDKFFGLAKKSLVDGVIIPDLPVEEAADYKKAANKVWHKHDFPRSAFYFQ